MIRIAIAAVVLTTACQSPNTETPEAMIYADDPHSFSEPNTAVVKHLDLELDIRFDQQKIHGKAIWSIEAAPEAEEIIFDTDQLTITGVSTDDRGEVSFELGAIDPELGQPLHIPITGATKQVTIEYTTSPEAKALQWLSPQQTAGKEHPFLFTQSQAILARSWIPCQDGPGIRFTYNAAVHTDNNLLPVMSAGGNPTQLSTDQHYTFQMEQPIPSYLLALAVGNLEFREVSHRTGVYAEPNLIDSAAWEFADMEDMVVAAEELYGPYAWGRYDLIVLPPSFPFGGMENPLITFATPTIIAGDRSLVALVAHELAHSWSGNLVTNATWNDFWLNEGFTVYFEQRIMEAVYGREYSEMLASLSYEGLVAEVNEFMESKPEDTRLALELDGRNPDDGMTTIAYDKGYLFLRLLEETTGRERFDAFLRNYFDEYRFQVMTTAQFDSLLRSDLLTGEQITEIGIDEWIYGTGLPNNAPVASPKRFVAVERNLKDFMVNDVLPDSAVTEAWTTHEWLRFIKGLSGATKEQLAVLDKAYALSQSGNSEILAAWFQPVIRARYAVAYPVIERFLINVGRRKFLTPTYKAMLETDQKAWAVSIYEKARPNYHAVARETMDELLGG